MNVVPRYANLRFDTKEELDDFLDTHAKYTVHFVDGSYSSMWLLDERGEILYLDGDDAHFRGGFVELTTLTSDRSIGVYAVTTKVPKEYNVVNPLGHHIHEVEVHELPNETPPPVLTEEEFQEQMKNVFHHPKRCTICEKASLDTFEYMCTKCRNE